MQQQQQQQQPPHGYPINGIPPNPTPPQIGDMYPHQQPHHQNQQWAPPPRQQPQNVQQQYYQHQQQPQAQGQLPPPGMLHLPLPSTATQNAMYGGPAPYNPLIPTTNNLNQAAQQERPSALLSKSGINGKGINYSLTVEQQPQRARMCGFGDKDRRPITPPPCVRLQLTDANGRPVNMEDIDGSFFVLQVDLWSEHADREVNIVRASNSTPTTSISTATTTSFPPTMERQDHGQHMMYFQPNQMMAMGMPPDRAGYPGQFPPQMMPMQYGMPMPQYIPPQPSSTMFTRNLIGSLTVNASRLNDPDGVPSYWFVLQDLSVRTEGWFRLKMNFIDVGAGQAGLNRGKAPILAWVFSEPFQVFSAKKFPGVIESTTLSKCFAGQGIKIPIRKDAKAEDGGDNDYEG